MVELLMLAAALAGIGVVALAACLWIEDHSRRAIAADQAKRLGYRQR